MVIKIIVGVLVIMIIAVIITTIWVFKKPNAFVPPEDTENMSENGVPIADVKTNWLKFAGFEGNYIALGDYSYRAIIECSSINYDLLSFPEQERVDNAYARFLNSLSFPIEIYIQTREFNTAEMLSDLEKNIKKAIVKFPSVADYAEKYFNEMTYLTDYINNSKIKKKFIVVPFSKEDLSDLSALNTYELKEFCVQELTQRVNIVCSNLVSTGVSCKVCSAQDVAEVIYSYYHRDSYAIARDMITSQMSGLVVNGANTVNTSVNIDVIIDDTIARLENELSSPDVSVEDRYLYQTLVETIRGFKEISARDFYNQALQSYNQQEVQ